MRVRLKGLKKGADMKYIITATYQGRKIERIAFSDFQVFTIINVLARDGATDIGMRKEDD